MLLGKRPRPPMKRTTSITEFTLDLSMAEAPPPPQGVGVDGGAAAASPRNQRRNFAELETSNFLRACSLCKRRLVPGRDIYMYKGDSAFCSLECRQQQMNHDERKDKCSLASSKKQAVPANAAAGSKVGSTK
ncbi:FCS-Like Zinc finger 5 [Camellia lanceoleosa]|uniref:FCS-Like Zinc finger 5 n=1 Tax=Camellia lanceoleosa TaxID=1840588 RepID=A0ACC0HP89_9ERIC|nr:FCS-Like Zinc finger 5 [Camellia lanceoleosa]